MLLLLKKIYGFCYQRYIRLKARYTKGWGVYYSKSLKLYFLLNKSHFIDFLIYQNGVFEPKLLKKIGEIIEKKTVTLFIDVGSHIGQMSMYVARYYPQTTVWSFEPDGANFTRQKMNMYLNVLDYKLFNQAITSQKEQRYLYSPKLLANEDYGKFNSGMLSLYADEWREGVSDNMVSCVSIDEVLADVPKNTHVLLKIDVESAEWEVIQGMEKTFEAFGNLFLIVEMLFKQKKEYAQRVFEHLSDLGWYMYDLNDLPMTQTSYLDDGDYIFSKVPFSKK